MTTYTIKHTASGETAEVDTDEEIVSPPIFDLYERHNELTYWSDTAHIEDAAYSLSMGNVTRAKASLTALGMELVTTVEAVEPMEDSPECEGCAEAMDHDQVVEAMADVDAIMCEACRSPEPLALVALRITERDWPTARLHWNKERTAFTAIVDEPASTYIIEGREDSTVRSMHVPHDDVPIASPRWVSGYVD